MDRQTIIDILSAEGERKEDLFAEALRVKKTTVGEGTYLRGLIEYSNICRKNCLYCGIRSGTTNIERYTLSGQEVMEAVRSAYENDYGSVVLQGGENTSASHISAITKIIKEIKKLSGGRLGITLSFGEQHGDVYKEWREAGAHRYLLRMETSSPDLYKTLHPADGFHDYDARIEALHTLKRTGYQLGTGVMVGLPGQTAGDLAGDLLFMKELDIDMCGMGPYITCTGTPMAKTAKGTVWAERHRFDMTLKMTAVLRILMPDINIAAATALQAIDPEGRMKAIRVGANVVMPNITPGRFRSGYRLYDNKPLSADSLITETGIKYGERGDSLHYLKRVGEGYGQG